MPSFGSFAKNATFYNDQWVVHFLENIKVIDEFIWSGLGTSSSIIQIAMKTVSLQNISIMIAKFSLILGVLAAAMILALQVLGVLESQETSDLLTKVLGVIAIFGIAGGVIGLIAGRSSKENEASSSSKPGPRF